MIECVMGSYVSSRSKKIIFLNPVWLYRFTFPNIFERISFLSEHKRSKYTQKMCFGDSSSERLQEEDVAPFWKHFRTIGIILRTIVLIAIPLVLLCVGYHQNMQEVQVLHRKLDEYWLRKLRNRVQFRLQINKRYAIVNF